MIDIAGAVFISVIGVIVIGGLLYAGYKIAKDFETDLKSSKKRN